MVTDSRLDYVLERGRQLKRRDHPLAVVDSKRQVGTALEFVLRRSDSNRYGAGRARPRTHRPR